MNHNIIFRELHSAEEDIVCKIVIDSFNEFIAPGYSSEGISEFILCTSRCFKKTLGMEVILLWH